MKKCCEKIYVSASDFPASSDTISFQTAIDEARRLQINVMVVTQKEDGTPWHLTSPVKLPSYFTVILSGCTVMTDDAAFINKDADLPGHTLASEAHKI